MRKLIENGNVYVARPPLFKVTQKKNVRFIKTSDEMTTELNRRGVDDTHLVVGETRIEGVRLSNLMDVLDKLEASLQILERRGVNLHSFLAQLKESKVPAWHAKIGKDEFWLHRKEDIEPFRQDQSRRLGRELVLVDTDEASEGDGDSRLVVDEFHEVHGLNRSIAKLADHGFGTPDLIPAPRIAGREPPIRYVLEHGESRKPLPHLRDLVNEVRAIGEKGLTITRFKGLGEMMPEELWETTLDPQARTLLQVTLVDAQKANDLFRTLMGEEVEERRNFIFEKGINVKDAIDYGA
jgi:DNA gyrase subunit B